MADVVGWLVVGWLVGNVATWLDGYWDWPRPVPVC